MVRRHLLHTAVCHHYAHTLLPPVSCTPPAPDFTYPIRSCRILPAFTYYARVLHAHRFAFFVYVLPPPYFCSFQIPYFLCVGLVFCTAVVLDLGSRRIAPLHSFCKPTPLPACTFSTTCPPRAFYCLHHCVTCSACTHSPFCHLCLHLLHCHCLISALPPPALPLLHLPFLTRVPAPHYHHDYVSPATTVPGPCVFYHHVSAHLYFSYCTDTKFTHLPSVLLLPVPQAETSLLSSHPATTTSFSSILLLHSHGIFSFYYYCHCFLYLPD